MNESFISNERRARAEIARSLIVDARSHAVLKLNCGMYF